MTNRVYIATNGVITTDDVAEPAVKVRAKYLKIIPGERVEARHATLYVAGVPVFYFPYYSRKLGPRSNQLQLCARLSQQLWAVPAQQLHVLPERTTRWHRSTWIIASGAVRGRGRI